MYHLCNEAGIIQEIKAKRLRWLAHFFKTDKTYPCRKLIFTNRDGARKVGRPTVKLMDDV